MQQLVVTVQQDDKATVLVLTGVLDHNTSTEWNAMWDKYTPDENQSLVLDLRQLDTINSSGLKVLWERVKPWIEQRTTLSIRDNERIRPLLALSGLPALLHETYGATETQSKRDSK